MSAKQFWYFISLFLLVLAKEVEPSGDLGTWMSAYKRCKSQGQSLPSGRITDRPQMFSRSTFIWTANYILDLGCRRNTGLYVELLPKTEINRGLCIHNASEAISLRPKSYEHNDFICKWDHFGGQHPDTLLNISNDRMLFEAVRLMNNYERYWISDIKINNLRFERECEVNRPSKDRNRTTFEWTSFTHCEENRNYLCVNNITDHYKTAISLVHLPRRVGSCQLNSDSNEQQQRQQTNNDSSTAYISIGITVVVLLAILITSCLNRRRFSELKNQIKKLQQQGFNHPMYSQEPLQVIQDSVTEPVSPTTPDNPSLYVNSTMSRGTNITVSYLTSTQIQNTVAITGNQAQQHLGIQGQQHLRLQGQSQIENHIEADTLSNGLGEEGLYSTVARKTEEKNQRSKIPVRDGAILHSNGYGALHNSLSYYPPNNRQPGVHNRQTSTEPSSSKPPYFRDISTLWTQNEVFKNNNFDIDCVDELRSFVQKNKPSPKPCVKHEIKSNNTFEMDGLYGRQLSETRSEVAFYINTGHEAEKENPDITDDQEDYEHIWQSST